MAEDQENTTFLQRAGGRLRKNKALATTSTGLSAAALIYLHGMFATKSELLKVQQAQAVQWQQISQLNSKMDELKGENAAYKLLLTFITTGRVSTETNRPTWTPQ
jgi:hypothetical protein